MDYLKHYDLLISRARLRSKPDGYVEQHHINPKCLGGGDESENLVFLTAKEHFVAHQLLAKVYGGKLVYAATLMSRNKTYCSRQYAWLKIRMSKELSSDTERAAKISASLKGKSKSKEHTTNWLEARHKNGSFFSHSPERRATLRDNMLGEKNPMFGKDHSESAKEKIRSANLRKSVCPHCNLEGGVAIMKRWHFDNCKGKPSV